MARRQEAAGVRCGAIRRGSWVAGAYRSRDYYLLLLWNQAVVNSLTSHVEKKHKTILNHTPESCLARTKKVDSSSITNLLIIHAS